MFLELLIAGHFQTYRPAPEPVKEETAVKQIVEVAEEPAPPEKEEPTEPSLEEKIRSNYHNCNTDTQYIRADNAHCVDKPVSKPQSSKTAATRPQNSSGNTYSAGYCTWGVKNWVSWVPNGWGNAYEWVASARSQGFTISNIPKVGDVAAENGRNHVAVVTKVTATTVTIKEMNVRGLYTTGSRTTPISRWTYIRP
jgi:surface antigen